MPAADAVNYAVAAIRNGTISTRLPVPAAILQEPFVPENPWARSRRKTLGLIAVIVVFGIGANVWAFFMRSRPLLLIGLGVAWLTIGGISLRTHLYRSK